MRPRFRIRNAMLAVAIVALLATIAVQQYQMRRLQAELEKARAASASNQLQAYYERLFREQTAASHAAK